MTNDPKLIVAAGCDAIARCRARPRASASHPPEQNRALLAAAGLQILRDRIIPHHEPGHGDVSFMWLLASKS